MSPTFSSIRTTGTLWLWPEHDRRADRRVPGKRQLHARREDAHRRGVPLVVRLGDEHRFGEVELAGDRLHLVVEQAVAVAHHGERIALEALRRKHVEQQVFELLWPHAVATPESLERCQRAVKHVARLILLAARSRRAVKPEMIADRFDHDHVVDPLVQARDRDRADHPEALGA